MKSDPKALLLLQRESEIWLFGSVVDAGDLATTMPSAVGSGMAETVSGAGVTAGGWFG